MAEEQRVCTYYHLRHTFKQVPGMKHHANLKDRPVLCKKHSAASERTRGTSLNAEQQVERECSCHDMDVGEQRAIDILEVDRQRVSVLI